MKKRVLFCFLATLFCYLATSSEAKEWVRRRESIEWIKSTAWNAPRNNLPRVLLIGDSICNRYSQPVCNALKGKANVVFLATSKCVCDKSYLRLLAFMLDEYRYDVIQFNNGLHSLVSDNKQWAAQLQEAIRLIKSKAKGATLVWATSTPLRGPKMTARCRELNAIAAKIMTEEKVPTLDLFALMDPLDRKAYWVDDYHHNRAGIAIQTRAISENILKILKERAAQGK